MVSFYSFYEDTLQFAVSWYSTTNFTFVISLHLGLWYTNYFPFRHALFLKERLENFLKIRKLCRCEESTGFFVYNFDL